MTWFAFVVLSLATYRLSRALTTEAGPWDAFERLRTWATAGYDQDGDPTGFWGTFLSCPWCVSVWIFAALALIYALNASWGFLVALPFAGSGLAGFLYERERG